MKRKSTNGPDPAGELQTEPDENDIPPEAKTSRRQKIKANIWIWHRRFMFWGGSNK